MVLGIIDWFGEWMSKFLFEIVQTIFRLIHYLQSVFMILAGAKNINDIDGLASLELEGNTGNILHDILFGYWEHDTNNEFVGKVFMIFFFISVIFFVVAIAFAVLKSFFSSDRTGSLKKLSTNSLKALAYFFGIPILFYIGLRLTTTLFNVLATSIAGVLGNKDASIADSFFRTCLNIDLSEKKYDTLSITSMSYNQIEKMLGDNSLNIIGGKFEYIIAFIAGCVMLYSLFLATFGLVERIINICLLYVISPVVIASSPLDDGERLKTWKDLVLAKLLGAMGNILSMYIFMILIAYWSKINSIINAKQWENIKANNVIDNVINFSTKDAAFWIPKLLYLAIGCGGAFVCAKGSNLIANLISQRAGDQDGISQLASNSLAQGGMRLAKTLGLGAIGAVLGKNKANSKNSSASSSANNSPLSQNGGGGSENSATSNEGGFDSSNQQQTPNSLASAGGSSSLAKKIGKTLSNNKGKLALIGGAIAATSGMTLGMGLLAGAGFLAGKKVFKTGKSIYGGIKKRREKTADTRNTKKEIKDNNKAISAIDEKINKAKANGADKKEIKSLEKQKRDLLYSNAQSKEKLGLKLNDEETKAKETHEQMERVRAFKNMTPEEKAKEEEKKKKAENQKKMEWVRSFKGLNQEEKKKKLEQEKNNNTTNNISFINNQRKNRLKEQKLKEEEEKKKKEAEAEGGKE